MQINKISGLRIMNKKRIFMIYPVLTIWTMAICFFISTSYAHGINTVINVVFDQNLPPYQYVEGNKIKGLHIDVLNKIAEENDMIINYIPKNTLSECYDTLVSSEADIILGSFIGSKEQEAVKYTEEISQSNICMIAPAADAIIVNDAITTKHYLVSIQEGTTNPQYERRMQNVEYYIMSNQKRVFAALKSDKVKLAIGVKDSLLYQIKESNTEDDYTIINNFMGNIKYNMAVREDDTELLNKLNQSIQDLRLGGEYEYYYDKWIDENEYEMRQLINKVAMVIGFALLAFAIASAFNMRLNALLKKQVTQKTSELQIANHSLKMQIEETRNNAELNKKIVDNNPMGIIVINTDNVITLKNHSAQRYSGEDKELLGSDVFAIPLFKELLQDIREKIFNSRADVLNRIVTIREEADQKERYYRYSMCYLFHDNGSIRGILLLFDDATKDLEIRDRMYEAEKNKALNQFIAEIAHEIRNPLTAIKTLVELIPYKKNNPDFQEKLSQIVPSELDRINALIKTLIDYARPKEGVRCNVEVNEIIKNCLSLVNSTIDTREICLTCEIEGAIYIDAVENQIKQIFINLLLNGIEAVQENLKTCHEQLPLHIIVSSKVENQQVIIYFYDEGIGMSTEEMKKCTEIFYTTKKTGTGTGLAVCMQYVRENGGEIQFSSEKGKYTQVTITFPALERILD